MARWQLLLCIGKGVLFHGGKGGLNLLSGKGLGDFVFNDVLAAARDVFECIRKHNAERALPKEVESLANVPFREVRQEAAQVAREVAGDQPQESRDALADCLATVPSTVRRSLRRPSDPQGKTIPPGLTFRRAEDLIPILLLRKPRFKEGDKPLPGVDLVLQERLGVGGFGEVWKAANPHMPSDPPVALKFCLDEKAAKSLRNEVALLGRVRTQGKHPGIVQLRRTYLDAQPPFLEYEYVEGGDLGGQIREWHLARKPPTPQLAAKLVLRLAEIMAFAHSQQIVHRDLKPANVLVRRDKAGGLVLKVADFGVGGLAAEEAIRETRRTGGGAKAAAETVLGGHTPLYAPPEQQRGGKPSFQDDVYALGVIWYQLLTGDMTKGAPTGDGWKRRLAEGGMADPLIGLLTSCFEEPEDRPRDAGVLKERLTSLVGGKAAVGAGAAVPAKEHATRAQTLLRQGQWDQAIAAATEAIRLGADDGRAHGIRAEAHYGKGDWVGAAKDADAALQKDLRNGRAYCIRADVARMRGYLDQAVSDATEAIRLSPNDAWPYRVRADAHLQRGDYQKAVADADKALHLEPGHAFALEVKDKAYAMLEDPEEVDDRDDVGDDVDLLFDEVEDDFDDDPGNSFNLDLGEAEPPAQGPITVQCPSCKRSLRVPSDSFGKQVKCPSCGEEFHHGPISLQCPSCGMASRVPSSVFGKKVKCPRCENAFICGG